MCTTRPRGSSIEEHMPDRPASYLSLEFCWLSLTPPWKEAPLPQKPCCYLEESPAAHCAWVSFKSLGGSFSVEEIHTPSPFAKAKRLIVSRGCTHPPRPSTGVGEKKRRPFSTIPIASQDRQNEIHLYQLFHFMFLTGQSRFPILYHSNSQTHL